METFSSLLVFCAGNSSVTGEFHVQRPVAWGLDVFFDLSLNKRLTKQSWGWWSEMSSRSLWLHCNAILCFHLIRIHTSLSHWQGKCFHDFLSPSKCHKIALILYSFQNAFFYLKTSFSIEILLMMCPYDNRSAFVQVIAWCRQTSNHCLNKLDQSRVAILRQ